MPDRFPGYDVLAKRDTPSWNEKTRRGDRRAAGAAAASRGSSTAEEFATGDGHCRPASCRSRTHRPPIPVAALVDHKLHRDEGDGYRHAGMPPLREAWRHGLARAGRGGAARPMARVRRPRARPSRTRC